MAVGSLVAKGVSCWHAVELLLHALRESTRCAYQPKKARVMGMSLQVLVGLTFMFSVGIPMQILGCVLYNNWWPMLSALITIIEASRTSQSRIVPFKHKIVQKQNLNNNKVQL